MIERKSDSPSPVSLSPLLSLSLLEFSKPSVQRCRQENVCRYLGRYLPCSQQGLLGITYVCIRGPASYELAGQGGKEEEGSIASFPGISWLERSQLVEKGESVLLLKPTIPCLAHLAWRVQFACCGKTKERLLSVDWHAYLPSHDCMREPELASNESETVRIKKIHQILIILYLCLSAYPFHFILVMHATVLCLEFLYVVIELLRLFLLYQGFVASLPPSDKYIHNRTIHCINTLYMLHHYIKRKLGPQVGKTKRSHPIIPPHIHS